MCKFFMSYKTKNRLVSLYQYKPQLLMKSQVLDYFKNLPKSKEEQYNKAFQLYRKAPGKSLAQESYYNRAGFTQPNLDNLHYDLKKLVGLKDSEIRSAQKIVSVIKQTLTLEQLKEGVTVEKVKAFLTQENVDFPRLPQFNKGIAGNKQMKSYCKEHSITPTSNKSVDLLIAVHTYYNNLILAIALEYLTPTDTLPADIEVISTTKEEVFDQAPDEVKEAIKLRDEFPFLDDRDCPEEMYILVGKKIAHYKAYVKAHENLLVTIKDTDKDASPIAMTSEEVTALALQAVEDFTINQDIYNELNHYNETGKILGSHPIFIERKLKESIDALTVEKATKRISNLDNYIRRDQKNAEKATTDKDKEKYLLKVKTWKVELGLIKAKFNFSNKN